MKILFSFHCLKVENVRNYGEVKEEDEQDKLSSILKAKPL